MSRHTAVVVMMVLSLAGCGGLHEMWESPGAQMFTPKSMAVLPPIVGAYEGARDAAQEVLTTTLTKRGKYERVLSPEEVSGVFQSSKEASDLLAAYYSKLETTGQSDADTASKLAGLLKTDSLLVVKVNSWEFGRAEGDNFAKVALGLRLINGSNGAIVWKARHDKKATYMIFKPALRDVAVDLSDEMLKYLPK